MTNPLIKFKNPSIHSKVMLCIIKHAEYQSPKLQRAITHEVFFRIYSKVNQVIYSSLPIHSSTFKALASTVFEIFLLTRFHPSFFQGAITQKRGITLRRKKIRVSYFFLRNPYMKFQNQSISQNM